MIQTEERLNDALKTQETLATEMSHRVKNLLVLVESMMCLSARRALNKEDLVAKFTARLHALADANALLRRGFDHFGMEPTLPRSSHVSCGRMMRVGPSCGGRPYQLASGRPTISP
jgi:two-component sensor histidine kinase